MVIIEGYLPPKALELVIEWIGLHQNELQIIWETQNFREIKPLE